MSYIDYSITLLFILTVKYPIFLSLMDVCLFLKKIVKYEFSITYPIFTRQMARVDK